MDFTRGEAELEVSSLAAQVLGAASREDPPDQDQDQDRPPGQLGKQAELDAATWKELAQAGLLALALPPAIGGDGLGVAEVAALLTEVGRHAARVPALATLALGVLPLTRLASPEVQHRLLAGVATGETILTAAIREPSEPMPQAPATVADLHGGTGTGTVSGVKLGVPYAAAAGWILVPASLAGGGSAVVVVDSEAAGLSCLPTHSSSGMPEYTVRLDRAPVRHVLPGDSVAELYRLAVAGVC